MSYNYITPDNIEEQFRSAKKYMEEPFRPLREYERIARNRPHPGIAKGYPKNTDGTLSAIIKETPKRVVQQEPNGLIKSNDSRPWVAPIVQFLIQDQILPMAKSQGTVLQKSWAVFSKAMTYGCQPTYTFYGSEGDYYGADFKVPYIKDVFFQPGQLTARDCDYVFIRSWYQETDLKAIIDREKKLDKGVKSGWDVSVLKEAMEHSKKKTSEEKSGGEDEINLDSSGIEIVTAFQKGVKCKFFSYVVDIKKICRTKVNPDPRGEMPIQFMYYDMDLSNPLGRGSVELSGGMQNVLDSMIQANQFTTALMLNPPLKVRGTVDKSSIRYKAGSIWNLGVDQNSSVEAVNINTAAMTNFGSTYGLMKSQILNLNNSTDTSISAEVGNPGYSKTPKGIQAMQAKLGVSDNYLRKQYETWFSDVLESMVNIHLAEKSGAEELELDKDTVEKIRSIDESLIKGENIFRINYDEFKDVAFKFEVDPTSSMASDTDQERESTLELLGIASQNPILLELIDMRELTRRVVSNLEDPEKIVKREEEMADKEQQMMQEQQMQQEGQIDPAMQQQMMEQQAMEQQGLQQEQLALDAPQGPPIEPGSDEFEAMTIQLIEQLRERGIPDAGIAVVVKALEAGASPEEALELLTQGGQ